MTKTGRGASLWVKGHSQAREAGGIRVEGASEALRRGEISMEVSVGRGRGPKMELVGGQQQLRGKGTARESGV